MSIEYPCVLCRETGVWKEWIEGPINSKRSEGWQKQMLFPPTWAPPRQYGIIPAVHWDLLWLINSPHASEVRYVPLGVYTQMIQVDMFLEGKMGWSLIVILWSRSRKGNQVSIKANLTIAIMTLTIRSIGTMTWLDWTLVAPRTLHDLIVPSCNTTLCDMMYAVVLDCHCVHLSAN